LSNDSKQKTAGRACLNIAVANEVLGNTELALDWAKKSYEYYDDKLGRSYSKIYCNLFKQRKGRLISQYETVSFFHRFSLIRDFPDFFIESTPVRAVFMRKRDS